MTERNGGSRGAKKITPSSASRDSKEMTPRNRRRGVVAPSPPPATYAWRGDPLLELTKEHLPTVIAGALALSAIWAVLSSARFNFATALAILAASDPAVILAGTAVTWAPLLGPVVFAGFTYWLRSARGPDRPLAFSRIVLLVVFLFAVAVTPLVIWLGSALMVGLILASSRIDKWFYARRPTAENLRAIWAGPADRISNLLITGLLLLSIGQAKWLAPEAIRIDDETFTAYVLSAESEWTAILRKDPRTVIWTSSADVESRAVCSDDRTIWYTALQILFGPPPLLPYCPE